MSPLDLRVAFAFDCLSTMMENFWGDFLIFANDCVSSGTINSLNPSMIFAASEEFLMRGLNSLGCRRVRLRKKKNVEDDEGKGDGRRVKRTS